MDNLDDPYNTLVQSMREEGAKYNSPPFLLGEVACVSPLLIKAGGVQHEEKDILINVSLLKGHKREIQLDIEQSIHKGTYTTMDSFSVGDKLVLLMSQDQQQFIVLCKVR